MKTKIISLIVFLFFFSSFSFTKILAQSAENLIKNLEQNIKLIELFSYKSSFKQISSSIEDSVYSCSGNVWGKKAINDSIFNCYFHVKGNEKRSMFDYYYDGQNGVEILHSWKKITIIDPYKYSNNPNNPAKARIVLLPFIDLLIDENIYSTLFKDNPEVTLEPDTKYGDTKITFIYPPNSIGQELTRKLFIDLKYYVIKRIETLVLWNGTTQKTYINISNLRINEPEILNNVSMTNAFADYSTNVYEQNKGTEQNQSFNMVGKLAPTFTFKSFSDKTVSPLDYKGKLVLLDFWETWCGHCIVTLPKINELYKKYQNKKFQILGITTENTKQIKKIIDSNNLLYTNLIADKSILDDYHVSNRPTYILINEEGKIILVTYGDLETIEKKIEEVFKDNYK